MPEYFVQDNVLTNKTNVINKGERIDISKKEENPSEYRITYHEESEGYYTIEACSADDAIKKWGIMANNGEIDFSRMEVVNTRISAVSL